MLFPAILAIWRGGTSARFSFGAMHAAACSEVTGSTCELSISRGVTNRERSSGFKKIPDKLTWNLNTFFSQTVYHLICLKRLHPFNVKWRHVQWNSNGPCCRWILNCMSVFEGIHPQALHVHGCCVQVGSDPAASCPCSEGAPHTPGDCAPERTNGNILFLIMQKSQRPMLVSVCAKQWLLRKEMFLLIMWS